MGQQRLQLILLPQLRLMLQLELIFKLVTQRSIVVTLRFEQRLQQLVVLQQVQQPRQQGLLQQVLQLFS